MGTGLFDSSSLTDYTETSSTGVTVPLSMPSWGYSPGSIFAGRLSSDSLTSIDPFSFITLASNTPPAPLPAKRSLSQLGVDIDLLLACLRA